MIFPAPLFPLSLIAEFEKIAAAAHLDHVAVAVHDTATGQDLALHGDRPFHAASTFKAALLLAFVQALGDGRCRAEDHLQVRNRFLGATDGLPYRIARDRDGDASVHGRIGHSLPLQQLARVMITRSSNLATNLMLDFLGLEQIHAALRRHRISGVEVRRGVEDLAAHGAGLNNETTAAGLCQLFRCFLPGSALAEPAQAAALEILGAQEFNRMIPALLPKGTRVAHKTGEISTHGHDAGIVFPAAGAPYVITILTESARETEHRPRAVAQISALVYRHLRSEGGPC